VGSIPTASTKHVMGAYWIRQTTEGLLRIVRVDVNTKNINANDDVYALAA